MSKTRKGQFVTMLIAALVACLGVCGGTAFANESAQSKNITVMVNGVATEFEQKPVVIDGHVMVPVRPVAEAMGWEVTANNLAIYLINHGEIEIIPGRMYYTNYKSIIGLTDEESHVSHVDSVGGVDTIHFNQGHYPVKDNEICPGHAPCIVLDQEAAWQLVKKPIIVNDRLLVEINDLASALYSSVVWDDSAMTVAFTSGLLPYYDGEGLPVEYREANLQKKMAAHAMFNSAPVDMSAILRDFEAEVFRLINEARIQDGLQPFKHYTALDTAVQVRAEELLTVFSHTRPNGEHCSSAYADDSYTYNGENMAISMLGQNGASAATIVADMWLSSPGHRANVMNPDSVYMSVGAVSGPNNKVYCVQGFLR